MKLTKPRKIVLGGVGAFIIALALNWNEFMEGFKKGSHSSSGQTQSSSFPIPVANQNIQGMQNVQNANVKTTQARGNLQTYTGQVFQILKPSNWKVVENRSAIDVYDPSMGETLGASGAVLMGAVGQTDPMQYADWFLSTLGVQIHKVVGQKMLPSFPGMMGTEWQRGIKEYIVSKGGQTLHAMLSVAVCNGWGQFSVIMTSTYAPESMWAQWAPTLFQMAESFKIINAGQVGGVREISANLPRNNPLDSSSIMSSWEYKNRSDDRISQWQQEATMGYQRGMSDTTGQSYDMPLNSYDPTVGGYRNPDDPSEILNVDYNRE